MKHKFYRYLLLIFNKKTILTIYILSIIIGYYFLNALGNDVLIPSVFLLYSYRACLFLFFLSFARDLVIRDKFSYPILILLSAFCLLIPISLKLSPMPTQHYQLVAYIHLLFCTYIAFTASLDCGNKKFAKWVQVISLLTITLLVVVNIISLIFYFCIIHHISLPGYLQEKAGNYILEGNWHTFLSNGQSFRFVGLFFGISDTAYSNICGILLTGYLLDNKKINRLYGIVSILLGLIMIYLSDSRTGYLLLGIVLIAAIYRIFLYFAPKKKANLLGIILLVIVFFACVFVGIHLLQKIKGLNPEEQFSYLNSISSSRITMWEIAIDSFKKSPITGMGYYHPFTYPNSEFVFYNYHNLFLTLLAQTGLVGTGLFCAFLIMACWKLIKNRHLIMKKHAFWLLVLVITEFANSLNEWTLIADEWRLITIFFWICLGYLVFLDVKRKRPENDNGEKIVQ